VKTRNGEVVESQCDLDEIPFPSISRIETDYHITVIPLPGYIHMSSSKIPVWATKVVDATTTTREDEFQTSTQQSANLFRIECARKWQQHIYQAQRRAWLQTVQYMMMMELEDTSTKITAPNNTESQDEGSASPLLQHYNISFPKPTHQDTIQDEDEWLLPVTILSPPPTCRLDRQAVSEAIWTYFRSKRGTDEGSCRRCRCRCLWLPRLLPTLHATMHLLVRQCIHPIPNDYDNDDENNNYNYNHDVPFHRHDDSEDVHLQGHALRYYRKLRKKRTTSMQQILLWWAARTSSYDSLVIVLEVSIDRALPHQNL